MGIFGKIFKGGEKSKKAIEQVHTAAEIVVGALNDSGYKADYSLESMKEIDRFFDEQSGEGGIISKNRSSVIFALGSYVGETVIKLYGGEWITNGSDPKDSAYSTVKLANGASIQPVIRCIQRYNNGAEDSIYDYVYVLSDKAETAGKNTLEQDIHSSADWVVTALNSSGYKADYSLESMKEVDRFFDEQSGEGGIISRNRGAILFALGSYVGETVIRLYGGEWVTDDSDPQGEINISVKLESGTVIWPVVKCMKRYQNGAEDSIYAYVYVLSGKAETVRLDDLVN